MSVEGKSDEELEEYLDELNAPLDKKQRDAERRWLMRG